MGGYIYTLLSRLLVHPECGVENWGIALGSLILKWVYACHITNSGLNIGLLCLLSLLCASVLI